MTEFVSLLVPVVSYPVDVEAFGALMDTEAQHVEVFETVITEINSGQYKAADNMTANCSHRVLQQSRAE
jgi:hypothetical protein